PEKRRDLERITHPRIKREFSEQLQSIRTKRDKCIIQAVIPLLIESGMQGLFHRIAVVYAPREVQKQRLLSRDNLSEEQAEARLRSQMPLEEKCKYADYVIINQNSLDYTRKQVEDLWSKLRLDPD
ncbi:MAG: dephospho-CoA kinase, partial [Thermodesulfobacteriota bacterium]